MAITYEQFCDLWNPNGNGSFEMVIEVFDHCTKYPVKIPGWTKSQQREAADMMHEGWHTESCSCYICKSKTKSDVSFCLEWIRLSLCDLGGDSMDEIYDNFYNIYHTNPNFHRIELLAYYYAMKIHSTYSDYCLVMKYFRKVPDHMLKPCDYIKAAWSLVNISQHPSNLISGIESCISEFRIIMDKLLSMKPHGKNLLTWFVYMLESIVKYSGWRSIVSEYFPKLYHWFHGHFEIQKRIIIYGCSGTSYPKEMVDLFFITLSRNQDWKDIAPLIQLDDSRLVGVTSCEKEKYLIMKLVCNKDVGNLERMMILRQCHPENYKLILIAIFRVLIDEFGTDSWKRKAKECQSIDNCRCDNDKCKTKWQNGLAQHISLSLMISDIPVELAVDIRLIFLTYNDGIWYRSHVQFIINNMYRNLNSFEWGSLILRTYQYISVDDPMFWKINELYISSLSHKITIKLSAMKRYGDSLARSTVSDTLKHGIEYFSLRLMDISINVSQMAEILYKLSNQLQNVTPITLISDETTLSSKRQRS